MILVTGATGRVGSALLPRLVERGAAVRALAHTPAGRARIEAQGVEAVEGDLDRPETLAPALAGCDHLLLVSPVAPGQVQRETDAVDAAKAAGVAHVVALSVMGADPGSPAAFARWHSGIDDYLVQSGLGWTILRPAGFMSVHLWPVDSVRGQGRWYGMTGDGASAFVAVEDVADVVAAVLTTEGHLGAVYEVTGPQAISMPEAAAQLSEVLDRPVDYVDLPAEQYAAVLAGAGLPGWLVDSVVALYGTIRAGHAATVSHAVEEVAGRPARSYRDFAEANRAAFTAEAVAGSRSPGAGRRARLQSPNSLRTPGGASAEM